MPWPASQVAPAFPCDPMACQVANIPQMQVQAPMVFQPMQQMQHVTASCQQMPPMPQMMRDDFDWLDTCSQFGAPSWSEVETRASLSSDCDEQHFQSGKAKLSASAARRQRRQRATERLAQAGAEDGHPSTVQHRSKVAGYLTLEEFEQLRLHLSEGNSQEILNATSAMQGKVWNLAQDATGCRLVQLAFERADQREAAKLVKELHGHVCEAATSPHANYVLQKVVSQLNVSTSSFIAEELAGNCARIVRHRFGCRIFCRLLEFCGTQDSTQQLINELLNEAEELCCHNFGHHVIQSVLEHGNEEQHRHVATALLADTLQIAKHKHGSYLIERAVNDCCHEDQQAILMKLVNSDALAELALSEYGCYVIRSLLLDQADKIDLQAALATIRTVSSQLVKTGKGQRLLVDLGLALPLSTNKTD